MAAHSPARTWRPVPVFNTSAPTTFPQIALHVVLDVVLDRVPHCPVYLACVRVCGRAVDAAVGQPLGFGLWRDCDWAGQSAAAVLRFQRAWRWLCRQRVLPKLLPGLAGLLHVSL